MLFRSRRRRGRGGDRVDDPVRGEVGERDGGGGLTAAKVLEFGVREGRDDAGDEGDSRRAAVEEHED